MPAASSSAGASSGTGAGLAIATTRAINASCLAPNVASVSPIALTTSTADMRKRFSSAPGRSPNMIPVARERRRSASRRIVAIPAVSASYAALRTKQVLPSGPSKASTHVSGKSWWSRSTLDLRRHAGEHGRRAGGDLHRARGNEKIAAAYLKDEDAKELLSRIRPFLVATGENEQRAKATGDGPAGRTREAAHAGRKARHRVGGLGPLPPLQRRVGATGSHPRRRGRSWASTPGGPPRPRRRPVVPPGCARSRCVRGSSFRLARPW